MMDLAGRLGQEQAGLGLVMLVIMKAASAELAQQALVMQSGVGREEREAETQPRRAD
jgi:hypothetical protein